MMASATEFIAINSQALEDADDEQLSSCYMLEQDNLFPNFTIGTIIVFLLFTAAAIYHFQYSCILYC